MDVDQLVQSMLNQWPYDLALQAFRRADIDECVNFTAMAHTPQALLLQARAMLRLKKPDDALKISATLPHFITRAQQAEQSIIEAFAYTQLGDFTQAMDAASNANLYSVTFEPFEAEAMTACSRFRFHAGNFDIARSCLNLALGVQIRRQRLPGEPSGYTMQLPLVWAQVYDLQSVLEAFSGDYHAKFRLLQKSLPFSSSDMFEKMLVLEHLAGVVCDLDLVEEVPALLKLSHALTWTGATSHEHVFTAESLGWCMALHGDFANAEREFQEAFLFSRDPEMRLSTLLYRAQLAREIDSEHRVDDLLNYAEELASHVCWEHVGVQEQHGLLMLAEELAATLPTHAQAALDQYRRISIQHPIESAEPKMQAWEVYIEGLIARAYGFDEHACSLQTQAFEQWQAIDFDWHAALCALELCELGASDLYAPYVKTEAEKRPDSWIAHRMHRVLEAI